MVIVRTGMIEIDMPKRDFFDIRSVLYAAIDFALQIFVILNYKYCHNHNVKQIFPPTFKCHTGVIHSKFSIKPTSFSENSQTFPANMLLTLLFNIIDNLF